MKTTRYFILSSLFICVSAVAMQVKVQLVKAESTDWGRVYQSHVSAFVESPLSFQVSGEVTRIYADGGQLLKKGEKMAQIDPLELNLRLKEAEVNLSSATSWLKLNRDRYKSNVTLYKSKHISPIELQTQKNKYVEAKNKYLRAYVLLKVAQTNLKRATLRAPYDLTIHERLVHQGQVIRAGQKVYEVFRMKPLEVSISVPEKVMIKLKTTQSARVLIKSLRLMLKAKIDSVGSKPVFANSYPVVLRLIGQGDQVKPGMHAEVQLANIKPVRYFRVPLVALVSPVLNAEKQVSETGLGAAAVFVYNKKTRRVKKVNVLVGTIENKTAIINRGLSEGDMLVVTNVNHLKSGQTVELHNR